MNTTTIDALLAQPSLKRKYGHDNNISALALYRKLTTSGAASYDMLLVLVTL